MNLYDADRQGLPLVVDLGEERRVVAHVFPHPDGVVFAEPGWCEPLRSFHAFHVLEGTLAGAGPWQIGSYQFSVMEEEDDLVLDWLAWANAPKPDYCSREKAEQAAQADLDYKV